MEQGDRVRVGIIGVGNCASCLVQGAHFYKENPEAPGLMRREIGPFGPDAIEFTAAFDVDVRKVGMDLHDAIYAEPNNADSFYPTPYTGVTVAAGPTMDGVGEVAGRKIQTSDAVSSVREHLADTDVLVNFLPVGSQQASEFYAAVALDVGCAFVNAIPTVIARNQILAEEFRAAGIPLIGDDVKSQVGATITHRSLVDLYSRRGVHLSKTYQLNVGGNMDFLNMTQRDRLEDKKVSKRASIQTVANRGEGVREEDLHVGPSDYVPFLEDKKLAFIRLEGEGFGGNPTVIEARFEAHDSQNSAGVVFDAVRYAALARLNGVGGVLEEASAWLMKAPPSPLPDDAAETEVGDWVEHQVHYAE